MSDFGDTSYLDDYLPSWPSIEVLGGGEEDYAKAAKTIKKMVKVVAALPPARRAVFSKQAEQIWHEYEAVESSEVPNKAILVGRIQALAARAQKVIKAAHASTDYTATTPGYAQQGPTAAELEWSRRPENQPGYVPPTDAGSPPSDAGTFLTRQQPTEEPAKSSNTWLWVIGGALVLVVGGSIYGAHRRRAALLTARGVGHEGKRAVPAPGGFLSGRIDSTRTEHKVDPRDLILGSDDKTKVRWEHLPLVAPEKTGPSRRVENTPTRAEEVVELSSLFDDDDKTPTDHHRGKRKK